MNPTESDYQWVAIDPIDDLPKIIIPDKGIVDLSKFVENIDDDDFKRILEKIAARWRDARPRKFLLVSRFSTVGVYEILAMLPIPIDVVAFNVRGHKQIGDAGMEHLHLLTSSSLRELNLTGCGITFRGAKRICEYMERNTSVRTLAMEKNWIGDEGAKYVGDMLCVNKTLAELWIADNKLGPDAFGHISRGLAHYSTLQTLLLDANNKPCEEHIQRLCPGLAANRGLVFLYLGCCLENTQTGFESLESVLKNNFHLTMITLPCVSYEIRVWLDLNKIGREIVFRGQEADLSEWHKVLLRCREAEFVTNAFYYFLRYKPELIYWCNDKESPNN